MEFPDDVIDDVQKRLRRVEGQIRGLQRMLDEGADCRDIVIQISAAKAALERAGFRLVASGMRYCTSDPGAAAADGMSEDEMEKLFLKLS